MREMVTAAALLAALGGCDGSTTDRNDVAAIAQAGEAADAAAETVRFVNSRQNALSDNLRRFYVDFSFDYPASWTVTPPRTDGTERNFVRVAAPPVDDYEPISFLVGSASGSGDAERDRREIERALPQFAEGFGSGFDAYRIVSIGRARVGLHESWSWRFSATAPGPGGRPTRLAGRGDILLPPGATRGVLIVSLVSEQAGAAADPARIGETEPLKAIYDSFRFARSQEGSRE